MSVLLDSVILIDHLNGVPAASDYLRSLEGAVISVVTRAEVLSGRPGRVPVTRLLDRYPTLSIDRETADLAAELRREHRWRLPDAFQAALAHLHGLQLATRNTRDFPPARHSFVVVPYSL
jgi:predicted nucleic acid-binding protein